MVTSMLLFFFVQFYKQKRQPGRDAPKNTAVSATCLIVMSVLCCMKHTQQIQSALLEGAPQGEARQIWWDEKLAFQFDEDDEEEEEQGASASTPPPVPGTPAPPSRLPPPAAPDATTTSQGGEGAGSGAASTASPTPALESAGIAVASGVELQAAVTPPEVVVEQGAFTSASAAAPVAATVSVADAAPTAPAVPLA